MTYIYDISIQLHRTRSGRPAGYLTRDGEQREFVGWVGLIAALTELMGSERIAGSAVAPDDLGGEGDP
jgi:hypothetical protein